MLPLVLLAAGLIVVLVALLARLAWVISHRWRRVHHRGAGARERRALDDRDPGVGPSRATGPVRPPWTRPSRRFKEPTIRAE